MIGQEGVGARFGAEREDGIGGSKDEDDKENEDETRLFAEEILIGSESEDEKRLVEEEPLIGWVICDERKKREIGMAIGREAAGIKSVGKGSEDDNRAAGGAGSITARSSLRLRSHSSPSSKATPQMSSTSVETSWSLTTPSYHCCPNCIRTLRPMKR